MLPSFPSYFVSCSLLYIVFLLSYFFFYLLLFFIFVFVINHSNITKSGHGSRWEPFLEALPAHTRLHGHSSPRNWHGMQRRERVRGEGEESGEGEKRERGKRVDGGNLLTLNIGRSTIGILHQSRQIQHRDRSPGLQQSAQGAGGRERK